MKLPVSESGECFFCRKDETLVVTLYDCFLIWLS